MDINTDADSLGEEVFRPQVWASSSDASGWYVHMQRGRVVADATINGNRVVRLSGSLVEDTDEWFDRRTALFKAASMLASKAALLLEHVSRVRTEALNCDAAEEVVA